MFLSINYPSFIHPEIFPGVPFLGLLRWYGLMYIFAFATAYLIMTKQRKQGLLNENEQTVSDDELFGFFGTGVLFLLLGARIFATLIYNTSGYYWKHPWLIFWPFDTKGNFTGLAGMSYHGGVLGGLLGMIIWLKRHKKNMWQWIDAMAIAIPFGFTFGRLGNFLNGELYGRITTMPWGMIFPYADKFSLSIPWVQEFAEQAGLNIQGMTGLVNLPRHPSQLYEAFFEGIFLGSMLLLLRKKKPFQGFLACSYLIGYGVVRFIIEYFREPDSDLGFRIANVKDAPIYTNTSLLNISTGQILCFIMIIGGLGLLTFLYFKNKKAKIEE